MVLLIISGIIGLIICGIIGWSVSGHITGSIVGGFIGAVIALIIAIVVMIVINSYAKGEWVLTEEKELLALHDKNVSAVSGAFFLGCGQIKSEEEFYYVMYAKGKDGRIDFYKFTTSQVELYECETAGQKPCLKIWTGTFQITWHNIFSKMGTKYQIYIPAGSIIQNYNLDLK